jgi:hypothetical protein
MFAIVSMASSSKSFAAAIVFVISQGYPAEPATTSRETHELVQQRSRILYPMPFAT